VCVKYRHVHLDTLLNAEKSSHVLQQYLHSRGGSDSGQDNELSIACSHLPQLLAHIRLHWPAISASLRDTLQVDIEENAINKDTGKLHPPSALTKIARLKAVRATAPDSSGSGGGGGGGVKVLLKTEKFTKATSGEHIMEYMCGDYNMQAKFVHGKTATTCMHPPMTSASLAATEVSPSSSTTATAAAAVAAEQEPEYYCMRHSGYMGLEELQKVCSVLCAIPYSVEATTSEAKKSSNITTYPTALGCEGPEDEVWDALGEVFGGARSAVCDRNWMQMLLDGTTTTTTTAATATATSATSTAIADSTSNTHASHIPPMRDPFALTRPYAYDRFTCWNQYTNER